MAVERNNKNTEEQIKTACRYCVETYPKVEKQIRERVEYLEKEFKCFEGCINSEQYAEAEKYNLSEATLVSFRKQVKKVFKPYTNTVKSFLEVTKNESYATQDYYLELKKLNKKAIEEISGKLWQDWSNKGTVKMSVVAKGIKPVEVRRKVQLNG